MKPLACDDHEFHRLMLSEGHESGFERCHANEIVHGRTGDM